MKQSAPEPQFAVIVIGGGPAGMMSAGCAAREGARVLLLEKNPGLGKKLLISGGGRSNVTNAEFDTPTLLKKYTTKSKFLHSPFSQFSVKDTFQFFESQGMEIKIEAEKRAFPKSDTARSVLEALVTFMKQGKVVIRQNEEVLHITPDSGGYTVAVKSGTTYRATKIILSTGGMSHPETGSTGDGFRWLEQIKTSVHRGNAALVPINTREAWGHKLKGLAFAKAKISLMVDGKVTERKVGKILFTHTGLSGPAILNMSKRIGEAMEEGMVTLALDIFPEEDRGILDRRLQALFQQNLNKKIKNVLKEFIPASLVPISLLQNQLDGEIEVNAVKREERILLCTWLKSIVVTPTTLMGKDKAVITSGGVDLTEIDMRTMELKKWRGFYVVGDMLDIDRPSGGYSLQLCWTTGAVAGSHAGQSV